MVVGIAKWNDIDLIFNYFCLCLTARGSKAGSPYDLSEDSLHFNLTINTTVIVITLWETDFQ